MNPESEIQDRALGVWACFATAFATAFFFFYSLNTMNDPVFGIDFVCFHEAGRILARGDVEHLTDYSVSGGLTANQGPFLEHFHEFFFPESKSATRWIYLPGYAWIFRPLAGFDFRTAARIFLVFNQLLVVAVFLVLVGARLSGGAGNSTALFRRTGYLFLIFTFQPMMDNAWHGQVTGIIFVMFCIGYWLFRRGRPLGAGLVWGLMIPMKFYPGLILLYFVWKRQWRVVAGAIVGMFTVLVISLMTAGLKGNLEYAQFLYRESSNAWVPAFNNQNLSGLLLHAFTRGDISSWTSIQAPVWLGPLRIVMILSLLGAAFWSMRKGSDEVKTSGRGLDLDLSLVILLMLLISPATWYHHYYWILFPLIVLFDEMLFSHHGAWKGMWFMTGLGYAFVVVQGISVLYPMEMQSLQNVWILRVGLSQSTLGALLLFAALVIARSRKGIDTV